MRTIGISARRATMKKYWFSKGFQRCPSNANATFLSSAFAAGMSGIVSPFDVLCFTYVLLCVYVILMFHVCFIFCECFRFCAVFHVFHSIGFSCFSTIFGPRILHRFRIDFGMDLGSMFHSFFIVFVLLQRWAETWIFDDPWKGSLTVLWRVLAFQKSLIFLVFSDFF